MRAVPRWLAEAEETIAAVFARQGYDHTRMEDLSAATGVPRATLYYHFAGKEEVLEWLLRSTLVEVAEAVAGAVKEPGDARRRLELVVRALLASMGRRPAACRVLLADLGRAGHLGEIAAGIMEGFHGPVLDLLAEGAADGSLRPVADPVRVAAAVFGAVTVAALQSLLLDAGLDEDGVASVVLDVVFGGLEER
ncbi:MAG: TetR/AcrR family transcriptional regulator [Actinomycetota bacterium]